jgi:hypothetical protein
MSWDTLLAIGKMNANQRAIEASRPPTTCPIDAEVLDVHPLSGERNCPMGNYRWSGGVGRVLQIE